MGVLIAVVAIIVAVRLWARFGPARAITGPVAAALLVAVSGLTPGEAGFTISGLWYGLSAGTVIALAYLVLTHVPAARRFFRRGYPRPYYTALVSVPLATVVFEEVAFRGVLWGLIHRHHGPFWATAVTAVLFGLWHLAPERPWTDAVATAGAGVVLGTFRAVGGGLLAPAVIHWAADGLGVLAASRVTRDVDQWGATQSGPG